MVVNEVSPASLFEASGAESGTPISDVVWTERLCADAHTGAQFQDGWMQRAGPCQKGQFMPSGGQARAERCHAGHRSASALPEPRDCVQNLQPVQVFG
jgi:hypothetical protein